MKAISLSQKRLEKDFDRYSDPCTSCNDNEKCKTTCVKADDWWMVFAKLFKRGEA